MRSASVGPRNAPRSRSKSVTSEFILPVQKVTAKSAAPEAALSVFLI
jgi:hypothetical protein